MKRLLPVVSLASLAGQRRLKKLLGRSALILNRKTLAQARTLVEAVRRRGDEALLEAAQRLDGSTAKTGGELALTPSLFEAQPWPDAESFQQAFEVARQAVTAFHRPQVQGGYQLVEDGITLEERRQPLRRVGIYVPGGRASYPSTVLMTVIPAQLAGVEEIVVVTPPRAYAAMPALRWTLETLGVREIWGLGGAQAVAALAYGTESVRRVDKIVGPGNAWVTAAKRLVMGDVAIDGLAGPTEVVIASDEAADPRWVAADLLAQAEHDPLAAAVLLTSSRAWGRAVAAAVEEQLASLATAATAREALSRFGAVLVVDGAEDALGVIEAVAPEHLQLVGAAFEALAPRIRNAGAIFVGASTPEVFGDYIAGPSHVLPTCGSARFASALGVEDFIRRSHVVHFSAQAAARRAGAAAVFADAEGLPAHAASARRRLP